MTDMGDLFDRDVPLRPGENIELPELVEKSVFHRNWAMISRIDLDRTSIETWDRYLDRNRRIFVPVDVQAFVVSDGDPEPTVPVTGGPGDPAPFADGTTRPPGVHLHWALPDALLRGAADPEATDLDFPELPDRWVVVRVLYPDGGRPPVLRGWVIDSVEGSVTPLADYAGTPATTDDRPTLDRLDGTAGGSLHWTAVYEASVNRFGFHDPLNDDQLENRPSDRATYVVAGWASTTDRDPLGPTRTEKLDLFELLDRLGWSATEMPAGEYRTGLSDLQRLRDIDLDTVAESSNAVEVRFGGAGQTFEGFEIAGMTRAADVGADKIVVTSDPPSYRSLFHGFVAGVPIDGEPVRGVDDRPRAENLDLAMGLDLNDLVAAWFADSWALTGVRRRSVELLTSAFTTDLLSRLTGPDGLREIEEHDHAGSFWSFAGPPLPSSSRRSAGQHRRRRRQPTRHGTQGSRAATPGRGRGTRGVVELVVDIPAGTGDHADLVRDRRLRRARRPSRGEGGTVGRGGCRRRGGEGGRLPDRSETGSPLSPSHRPRARHTGMPALAAVPGRRDVHRRRQPQGPLPLPDPEQAGGYAHRCRRAPNARFGGGALRRGQGRPRSRAARSLCGAVASRLRRPPGGIVRRIR